VDLLGHGGLQLGLLPEAQARRDRMAERAAAPQARDKDVGVLGHADDEDHVAQHGLRASSMYSRSLSRRV